MSPLEMIKTVMINLLSLSIKSNFISYLGTLQVKDLN